MLRCDRRTAELAARARDADIAPHDAVILDEYQLTTSERYRNTEVSSVREGQLVVPQAFVGGAVTA